MGFVKTSLLALGVAVAQALVLGVLVAWAVTHDEFGDLAERHAYMLSVVMHCVGWFTLILAPIYLALALTARRVIPGTD